MAQGKVRVRWSGVIVLSVVAAVLFSYGDLLVPALKSGGASAIKGTVSVRAPDYVPPPPADGTVPGVPASGSLEPPPAPAAVFIPSEGSFNERATTKDDRVFVLIFNAAYADGGLRTIEGVRGTGGYDGDIVVVTQVGDDELIARLGDAIVRHNLTVKAFPPIDISNLLAHIRAHPFTGSDGRELHKTFQWHKMYLFHPYFKRWKRVMYVDTSMQVQHPIAPIWDVDTKGLLRAHSDSYPDYVWKLRVQIEHECCPEKLAELEALIDLEVDYFQTGFLLFDTSLINATTLDELVVLMNRFPICRTNEQALMNIYFNGIHKVWKQLDIERDGKCLYDSMVRPGRRREDYIFVKW